MLNIGMSEILVFAIIALIVLGPDKLPTAVRTVIKWYRHIKLMIGNVQRDIERELEITEIREKMEQEIARFKEVEQQMQAQLQQIQKEVDQLEKEPSTTPAETFQESVAPQTVLASNTDTDSNTNSTTTIPTPTDPHKAMA